MKKSDRNLILLQTIYITCCIVSPVLSSKLIDFGFDVRGFDVTLPVSTFIYSAVFLVSNVVSSLWSKQQAIQLCAFGFVGQFMSTVLFGLFQIVPAYDQEIQSAYKLILSPGIYFFIAGACAYFVSMLFNIWMFNSNSFKKMKTTVRSTVCMILGQIIDSVFFLGISYGLFLKWIFSTDTRSMLCIMMVTQFIVRMLIAILCVPVFNILIKQKDS